MGIVTFKVTMNSIGIIMNIVGVWSLWKTSPTNFSVIDAGGASTNWDDINKKRINKNKIMDRSVVLILIGSSLQLVSNFLPE